MDINKYERLNYLAGKWPMHFEWLRIKGPITEGHHIRKLSLEEVRCIQGCTLKGRQFTIQMCNWLNYLSCVPPTGRFEVSTLWAPFKVVVDYCYYGDGLLKPEYLELEELYDLVRGKGL